MGDITLEEPPGEGVRRALPPDAALRVANLEGPLSRSGPPARKLIRLSMPAGAARWLQELGVDLVTLANNHMLDFGVQALEETRRLLDEAGVAYVGAGPSLSEAFQPRLFRLDSLKVAFLGVACTLPPGFMAGAGRPGIAGIPVRVSVEIEPSIHEEQPGTPPWVHTWVDERDLMPALEAVRAAREQADLVVVLIHWGVPPQWASPFQGELAEYQRPLAHRLVDAGAGAVVGHHPHALHGLEVYRQAPILYSVGNFVFHPAARPERLSMDESGLPYRAEHSERNRESLRARIEVAGGRVQRVMLFPYVLDSRFEPAAAEGEEGERLRRRLSAMSRELGLDVRWEADGTAAVTVG